jgi:hypothetical protein
MAQLHFSIDEKTAAALTKRARREGLSLSRYLARLVSAQAQTTWPRGYLDTVVGSCAKTPLIEPSDLELDEPGL